MTEMGAILQGIAEEVTTSHPSLRALCGVLSFHAREGSETRFTVILEEDYVTLTRRDPSKAGMVWSIDYDYEDPELFDKLYRDVADIMNNSV
jgi:hypothetical protein